MLQYCIIAFLQHCDNNYTQADINYPRTNHGCNEGSNNEVVPLFTSRVNTSFNSDSITF